MKKSEVKEKKLLQSIESKKEESEVVCKDEVKIEQVEGEKRWYEVSDEEQDNDNEKKWDYMEHHGALFPEPYHPRHIPITYNGKPIQLDAFQEEQAWLWCKAIGTDYQKSAIFRKNFYQQFTIRLKKKYPQINCLENFDFSKMVAEVEREHEESKNESDQNKLKRKMAKEEADRNYGFAIVDNFIEKVSRFIIEAPNLLRGRGQNPKAGLMKPRIYPEGVALNLAEDSPIPKCPMAGHSWGSIECLQDKTWLCSYKNNAATTSSSCKYVALAASSKFKGQNDRKKYEKARRLKRQIVRIREDYNRKITDSDTRNRQLGTATYLIDNLALRVGNEKGDDETDTKGCCTLLVENMQVLPNDEITLDFLGKDSIRYVNTVKVPHNVWKCISEFTSKKTPKQELFDAIDAPALNQYLKSQMEGLTAKVFRTFNASTTLEKQLKKVDLTGLSMEAKIEKYNQANRRVAILCNHQKKASTKTYESLRKRQQEIEMLKEYIAELSAHKQSFTTKRNHIQKKTQIVAPEGLKPLTKKFPQTKDATAALLIKQKQRLEKQGRTLKQKDEGKEIALGTSKTNYNDPRISVAWCKQNEVRIEKILNKNLLSKFIWAMYTDDDYEF